MSKEEQLCKAAANGDVSLIGKLIEEGVEVDYQVHTISLHACFRVGACVLASTP
jgi:hypothetical protein